MAKLFWAATISILIIVGIIIINSNNIDLKEPEGKKEFAIEYGKWLVKTGQNIKSLAGYVIDQDWSTNSTNSTQDYYD